MDDAYVILDEAGHIECASAAAAELFGYTSRELCGRPWSQVTIDPDASTRKVGDGIADASVAPLVEGVHRDGHRFLLRLSEQEIYGPVRSHCVLFLADPARPPSTTGIFTQYRELHELAARQGRIAVWEVDYRTNYLVFSPVLADMLGLKGEQVPRTVEQWKLHFHPDDWQQLEREADRMLRREIDEINVECRVFRKGGDFLWLLVRGHASFDEAGRPFRTIGTGIDITERKTVEKERDLFFTLSLDFLCVADINGYFRRVNPTFCRTLGFTEQEMTTRPFISYVHPDDTAATEQALSMLAKGKDVVAFENRYQCKDGGWRWLSWTCPAPQPGSDVIYAIAHDVTEQKRVAAQLEQAMRAAEKANRAKSEFLSRMSHELRTPLNAILGFGQLLQREPLGDRLRRQIDLIVSGGRHLLDLINEVLDITRIEAGKLDLSPEPVDVASVLQETVSLLQPMAQGRGIQVAIDLPTVEGQSVRADKQRLKQVLLNLIGNAIKYNREAGSVRIFGEPANGRFRIHVEDTGNGIPEAKRHRLFTPFDRLGAESTTIEGSGLGLVLSQRLMEVMGGTLTLQSEVGRGSTFTIELATPRHHVPAVLGTPSTAASPTTALADRTLLYIEDNSTNLQLMEAVLAHRPGVRLLTATHGDSGLALARQHRPDLILLDVHLPDTHGQALTATIHADPVLSAIPVIVISADATADQMQRLRLAGAKEYLTKPIDVDLFLQILDRYLQ